jgi:hypothetical protein
LFVPHSHDSSFSLNCTVRKTNNRPRAYLGPCELALI